MQVLALRCALCVLLAAGAMVDARERRLPNPLALALACTGALCALEAGGVSRLAVHACSAVVVGGALLAFELWWRRRHLRAGQGMGDLKALCALMVASPLTALASYAAALLALALVCVVSDRRSLPLVPFLAATFCLASAAEVWS